MNRKEKIHFLLKGIETGDPASAAVVSAEQYIQHNPQTKEGGEGLAALFKRLSKTSPRVNIVRIFEDGDYVFGQTEYEFSTSRVGFEVFRFEGGYAVEHWDNIQSRQGPNSAGQTMVDGAVDVVDLEKTEANRTLVQSFIDDVLINHAYQRLGTYMSQTDYIEHNPRMGSGIGALTEAFAAKLDNATYMIDYKKAHRFLAEGNFVLSVCEGFLNGVHTSFYDLFRVAEGKIVEHWDTVETVPPRETWQNNNGKF